MKIYIFFTHKEFFVCLLACFGGFFGGFFWDFIRDFRAKQVSHSVLLNKMEIKQSDNRKVHKLNNHMRGMSSWINIRLKANDLPRTSGLLPQLYMNVMSDTIEKMNDMLIKCSGVTKLEGRTSISQNSLNLRDFEGLGQCESKSRRLKGRFKTTTLH